MSTLVRGLRYATLATGFATMGAMKLGGAQWEVDLFRSWGHSADTRKAFGALEAIAALLVVNRRTRRLGAASMALVSLPQLMAEIDHGDQRLALSRFALLGLALTAVTSRAPRRRPARKALASNPPVRRIEPRRRWLPG